ncbi:hypothetical protein SETIT_2G021100v2 [Setaria italica]|uniref:Uncharacterized protein n=1 Tax=Setaria italica TaxID=4555 RepID=A0A368PU78_SETIT|nr:hypothetical protein SETIT_2G021100v2 [Setaria italica]
MLRYVGRSSRSEFQWLPTTSPSSVTRLTCRRTQRAQAEPDGWSSRCSSFRRRHWFWSPKCFNPSPPSSFGTQTCSQATRHWAPFAFSSPVHKNARRFASWRL